MDSTPVGRDTRVGRLAERGGTEELEVRDRLTGFVVIGAATAHLAKGNETLPALVP
jgi:hypothetical protein